MMAYVNPLQSTGPLSRCPNDASYASKKRAKDAFK